MPNTEISTQKFDLSEVDDIIASLRRDFDKPEIVKATIAAKRPVLEAAARLGRKVDALGLPVTTQLQRAVDDNKWLAPVDATLATAGKVAGGILIYKGVMWLYRFARGLV